MEYKKQGAVSREPDGVGSSIRETNRAKDSERKRKKVRRGGGELGRRLVGSLFAGWGGGTIGGTGDMVRCFLGV